MAQDIMHEQPFSLLELSDDFSTSSNKLLRSDDEESMNLDNMSLITSKTADFLNDEQKMEYKKRIYIDNSNDGKR